MTFAQRGRPVVSPQKHNGRLPGKSQHGATAKAASERGGRSIKTDFGIYPEPPAPALPRAGGKLVDPVFGTELLRVTDEADGPQCGTSYSYWPTFNLDSTRLIVHLANGHALLYKFDPSAFQLGTKESSPAAPGDGHFSFEDVIWSGTDPDLLYVHRGARLYVYNVARRAYTLAHDFARQLPTGHYLVQMSMSRDDDVFAFTLKNAAYKTIGYLVYRRSTNRIVHQASTNTLDEVQIDKTGRYLVVKTGQQGPSQIEVQVVDVLTGKTSLLTDNAPDYAPGHSDNGSGTVVGADNWLNRITIRNLATPHSVSPALKMGNNWTNDYHVSMLADDESWALVSFFTRANAGVFCREVVQVATDGSQRVQRLLHHHSAFRSYEDTPRANISRDGRFVAFTSNWGGRSRRDLFVARVPRAAALSLSPPRQASPRRRLPLGRGGWAARAVSTSAASSQEDAPSRWQDASCYLCPNLVNVDE